MTWVAWAQGVLKGRGKKEKELKIRARYCIYVVNVLCDNSISHRIPDSDQMYPGIFLECCEKFSLRFACLPGGNSVAVIVVFYMRPQICLVWMWWKEHAKSRWHSFVPVISKSWKLWGESFELKALRWKLWIESFEVKALRWKLWVPDYFYSI